MSIFTFILLTSGVNLSMLSLCLSKVSIASKVTPLLLVLSEDWPQSFTHINGVVDDWPVFCLSIFSFIITLLAVVIGSLILSMGNRIG